MLMDNPQANQPLQKVYFFVWLEASETKGEKWVMFFRKYLSKSWLRLAFCILKFYKNMEKFNRKIFHPAWVTGFIDGEGTFFVDLLKNSTMALGIQVQLQFVITQHIRDEALMKRFIEFFNTGTLVSDGPTKVQYRIRRFSDFDLHLFPLLDEYPLETNKRLDAEAFRKVHSLMKEKRHLTQNGLDEIKAIKATMNRARMKEFNTKNPLYKKNLF